MEQSLKDIINLYQLNNRLLERSFEKLTDEVAKKRLYPGGTPLNWILGHITYTRTTVLALLDQLVSHEELKPYAKPYNGQVEYLYAETLVKLWRSIADELLPAMEKADETLLAKKISFSLPHGDKTVLGALVFFCYHEAWHVGQISLLNKAAGLTGLAG